MSLTFTDEQVVARRTGILILAHAPLAGAFARVATDMGLAAARLATLDMSPDMSREQALSVARMLIADLHCDGCLVLVDLGGGASPFAVAQRLLDGAVAQTQIVCGLNVAMLVTALCHCHLPVSDLAARVVLRGGDGIQRLPPLA